MSATHQKNQFLVYLGIGLALLLGLFAADYLVPRVNIFIGKNALYQGTSKKAVTSGDVTGARAIIDAPPQPRPVANTPGDADAGNEADGVRHNYRLSPNESKHSRSSGDGSGYSVVTYDSKRITHAAYAAQFRLAQNQGEQGNRKKVGAASGATGSGKSEENGDGDKPTYFDAPNVQPSQRSAAQTTKGTSDSGQSDLVVVRNKDTEHELESKLEAGKRALRMDRYDAALSFFNDLYKTYKDEPRVLMGRAIALQRLGRTQAAKNTYTTLLDNDPDNVHAKINMYGIIKNTKPGLALRRLKALHEDHPQNAELAAQIGLINADIKKYDQAFKYLQIAVSIAPDNPQHLYNLGIVAEHKGKPEKAIQYYEKAVDAITVSNDSSGLSKEKIYDHLASLRDS